MTGGDDSMLCLWNQGVQPTGKDSPHRTVQIDSNVDMRLTTMASQILF